MTESSHPSPDTAENESGDALRRHPEGAAEGAEPAGTGAPTSDSDIPREHSEEPAEG